MAKTYEKYLFASVVSAVLSVGMLFMASTHAQRNLPLPPPPTIIWPDDPPIDPPRWSQEDVTPEQKYQTARQEALAAHEIAQNQCKTLPMSDQALCLAQERLQSEQEMAQIKAKFGITR